MKPTDLILSGVFAAYACLSAAGCSPDVREDRIPYDGGVSASAYRAPERPASDLHREQHSTAPVTADRDAEKKAREAWLADNGEGVHQDDVSEPAEASVSTPSVKPVRPVDPVASLSPEVSHTSLDDRVVAEPTPTPSPTQTTYDPTTVSTTVPVHSPDAGVTTSTVGSADGEDSFEWYRLFVAGGLLAAGGYAAARLVQVTRHKKARDPVPVAIQTRARIERELAAQRADPRPNRRVRRQAGLRQAFQIRDTVFQATRGTSTAGVEAVDLEGFVGNGMNTACLYNKKIRFIAQDGQAEIILPVVSDIHANAAAYQAVLNEIETGILDVPGMLNLGDLIGYGASPNEVIATHKSLCDTVPMINLLGNHEAGIRDAVAENNCYARANPAAQVAMRLTHDRLDDLSRSYVEGLRDISTVLVEVQVRDKTYRVLATHGSLGSDPFSYVWPSKGADDSTVTETARLSGLSNCDIVALGHTHSYGIAKTNNGPTVFCPGSVGQPRDTADHPGNNKGYGVARWALLRFSEEGVDIEDRVTFYDVRESLRANDAFYRDKDGDPILIPTKGEAIGYFNRKLDPSWRAS